jgi:hypothetical protein
LPPEIAAAMDDYGGGVEGSAADSCGRR